MAYTVQINEYQRKMMIKLMQTAMGNPHFAQYLLREKGDTHDTMYEEASSLATLMTEMPDVEAADPGVTHGLCL